MAGERKRRGSAEDAAPAPPEPTASASNDVESMQPVVDMPPVAPMAAPATVAPPTVVRDPQRPTTTIATVRRALQIHLRGALTIIGPGLVTDPALVARIGGCDDVELDEVAVEDLPAIAERARRSYDEFALAAYKLGFRLVPLGAPCPHCGVDSDATHRR